MLPPMPILSPRVGTLVPLIFASVRGVSPLIPGSLMDAACLNLPEALAAAKNFCARFSPDSLLVLAFFAVSFSDLSRFLVSVV